MRRFAVLLSCFLLLAVSDLATAETVVEDLRVGGFYEPASVSVNPTDNSCWVTDSRNSQVVRLSPTGEELLRVNTTGSCVSISVNPSDGSCWIAVYWLDKVMHLSVTGEVVWSGGSFDGPYSVSVNTNDNSCWVADYNHNQVMHLSPTGEEQWRGSSFSQPYSVSVNSSDNSCWVADAGNDQVVHLSSTGEELWRGGGFSFPASVSVNPNDDSCWVADYGNKLVVHLAEDGTRLGDTGVLSFPSSVSVNTADGSCWVGDQNVVFHLAEDGAVLWTGGGFYEVGAVSVNSSDGSCWVADILNNQVVHLVFSTDIYVGFTERVSVASDDAQGNGVSSGGRMSVEGRYVVFESSATNLIAGDTNNSTDIFLHDRQTGLTELISVSTGGVPGNGNSTDPWLSADGRYVAFVSEASDLVTGDANGVADVFLRDRLLGQTELVSVATNGTQGNQLSERIAMSSTARFVAWSSSASNFVSGDSNNLDDVFLRDRVTGVTERVSLTNGGGQANDESHAPAVSDDGRYVAFDSFASNIVSGDTNLDNDVFVRDRQTRQTRLVSKNCAGGISDGGSWLPVISADGRYIAFSSDARNLTLVPDTNGWLSDAFVYDQQTDLTERVSVTSSGGELNGISMCNAISSDGRYVAFSSGAKDVVPGDTNHGNDVFLHDRQTGVTELIIVPTNGSQQNGYGCAIRGISVDGRHVAFGSDATNVVGGDTNNVFDVFVRDRLVETGFHGVLNNKGKAPLTVTFQDLSAYAPSGPATAWAWDFGDGFTSTEQNPTHEYLAPGLYTVSLTATLTGTPFATIKEDYIAVSFNDVAVCPPDLADSWALMQILKCVKAGIVQGYPDVTYRPTVIVNRGQMAVYIARALAGGDDLVPSGPPIASFTDVATDHQYFKYVEYAVAQHVVQGYTTDNTYRPTVQLNRAQMAVFIARALCGGEEYVPTGPVTATFPDVAPGDFGYNHIEYIADPARDIASGYPDGTYRPLVLCRRDQMAAYVANAFLR